MAGISSSSSAAAAALPPPPATPAAEGGGASPLLDLLERFPDLFAQKVLQHLDPIDRTFLAHTGGLCRAAVAASDLPRAGIRLVVLGKSVWRVTHELSEFCTSVERLAWAKASGCPWVQEICECAARGGHLDVLQWAWAHDCPWDMYTCAFAAWNGHLDVLQWAREHGCPWTTETCYSAAEGGHLQVLRWAREHGCPWSKQTCEHASRNHPETLAWVQAQP